MGDVIIVIYPGYAYNKILPQLGFKEVSLKDYTTIVRTIFCKNSSQHTNLPFRLLPHPQCPRSIRHGIRRIHLQRCRLLHGMARAHRRPLTWKHRQSVYTTNWKRRTGNLVLNRLGKDWIWGTLLHAHLNFSPFPLQQVQNMSQRLKIHWRFHFVESREIVLTWHLHLLTLLPAYLVR